MNQVVLRWRPHLGALGRLDTAKAYFQLGKPRLTALVLGTTMAGYSFGVGDSLDMTTLGMTLAGTGLSSMSAHAFNQWAEAPYDAQMLRTRQRPLPAGKLLPPQAFMFGLGTGIAGVGTLAAMCNFGAAGLALSTILLYAGVYTPMKRISPRNTWVGSLVGAFPPAIGYAAAGASMLSLDALVLPSVLFVWQFPHFCALSWNLKADYALGGYRMMSVQDPERNTRTALLYSFMLPGICTLSSLIGQTSMAFILTSSFVNIPLIVASILFYRQPSKKSARSLFLLSLLHLPILMALMLFHKETKKTKKHQQ